MPTSLSNLPDVGFPWIKAASSGTHRTVQPFSHRLEAGGSAYGGEVLHLAADSEIYGDGDESTSFYKVLSGVVRTCKFRRDGRRQIDAFHFPGEIFGFAASARVLGGNKVITTGVADLVPSGAATVAFIVSVWPAASGPAGAT